MDQISPLRIPQAMDSRPGHELEAPTTNRAENHILVAFLEIDQSSPLRAEQAVDSRPGREFEAPTK